MRSGRCVVRHAAFLSRFVWLVLLIAPPLNWRSWTRRGFIARDRGYVAGLRGDGSLGGLGLRSAGGLLGLSGVGRIQQVNMAINKNEWDWTIETLHWQAGRIGEAEAFDSSIVGEKVRLPSTYKLEQLIGSPLRSEQELSCTHRSLCILQV
jgi:hypothetical protein